MVVIHDLVKKYLKSCKITKIVHFFSRYDANSLVSGGVYRDTQAYPRLELFINFKALFSFIFINFSPFLGPEMAIFVARLTRLRGKYLEFFDETKSVGFVRNNSIK